MLGLKVLVGYSLGVADGETEGYREPVGTFDNDGYALVDGFADGLLEGTWLGYPLGTMDSVGTIDGAGVGASDIVGAKEGEIDIVGCPDGAIVGTSEMVG